MRGEANGHFKRSIGHNLGDGHYEYFKKTGGYIILGTGGLYGTCAFIAQGSFGGLPPLFVANLFDSFLFLL